MVRSRRLVQVLNRCDERVNIRRSGTGIPFAAISDAVYFIIEPYSAALGHTNLFCDEKAKEQLVEVAFASGKVAGCSCVAFCGKLRA